ncbi:MAG: toxin-antitoxin system YwqK family antitoxin [Crocinitomicaceae bacterium]
MTVRKLLMLVLIVFLGGSVSAATPKIGDQGGINQKVDGKKQGKWVYLGRDRPTSGYPSEGKIEEGSYIDDRKEGEWIKYHTDGATPKLKGTYENNRPNGPYVKFWPDGTIKEQGTFSRNKYKGTLKRFHKNGVLEYEADYSEDGKEQGSVKYFYANGQEEFVYEAQNGIPNGKATRFYENGDPKEVIFYSADGKVEQSEQKEMVGAPADHVDPEPSREAAPRISVPRTKGSPFKANGYNKVYNENDEISQDGEFRDSRLWDGKVYVYDTDGILLKVKVFKKGVYHSDGQL